MSEASRQTPASAFRDQSEPTDAASGQGTIVVPIRRPEDTPCHFRRIVDLTVDYIYSKDLTGRIVDANTSYLHALGRTSEEVIGRQEADLFPAAVAAESAARDQIVLLTGQPLEVEAAVVMGGRPRALFVCSSPWKDVRGAVRGVITVATDISDQKRSELELAASVDSLRSVHENLARTERLRALGEMASGVAHDFNNSLTTMLGLSDWLLHTLPANAECRVDLEKIRTAAMDAAVFVRRLQQAGRLTRETDERESVDLVEIAREIPELCRPRWAALACRPGVDFLVQVDTRPVPPVRAVAAEIRELLTNLVFNAIDAMPDGGRLTVRTRTVDGQAQVSVEDEGCGVSEDVRFRMFEPFFTTKGKAGTGLGLSVCWSIAQRHGGTLEVQSAVGAGSTFTLTLPAEDRAGTTEVPAPISEARVPAQRILLVDDQADVRDSLTDLLETLGHHVTSAANGVDAMRLIDRERFGVLITDLGMPGVSGLEVAEHARASTPRMPVLLVTGWGTEYETGVPEHVSLVLSKPVTVQRLGEALGWILAEAGGSPQGSSFGPGGRASGRPRRA